MRQPYDGVVITAPVTLPCVRYTNETAHWWIARALKEALQVIDVAPQQLDGLSISSFTLAPDTPVGLTQHLGLTPRWLDTVPMGGASGVAALRRAARAVQCGDVDVVACVAGDTNRIDSFRNLLSAFSRFSMDATFPYGFGGPNASFALIQDAYMQAHGATRVDLGKIAVAGRANGLRSPNPVMTRPLALEDYLNARMISDPICLFDCVMPCAGAEAFVVMREDMARAKGLPFARIRSTIERTNAFPDDPMQLRGGWEMDVEELWNMASLGPQDMDLLNTYDDYPVISMMQMEDLGFCAKGGGPAFVGGHDLTIEGTFPHNTSGGQLSQGQAGAAGGYLGLVEAIRQVMQTAGNNQVPNARLACVSGFGVINYDRGLCSAAAVIEGDV